MKIISWNVRGLGGVKKRRSVRECIIKYDPTILILQETKKEDMNVHLVKSSMGPKLTEWCSLPVVGTSGGIIIAWDPLEVRKIDEIVGNFLVSIKLVEISFGFEWMFFGVYGPCRPQNQSDFWAELLAI